MEQPVSPSDCGQSGEDTKERRETILQRRNRVLGKKPLRSVNSKGKASSSSGDKRRTQVLQAQRVHRQRTIDYITELENEIFRLRKSEASLTSTVREKECQLEKLKQDLTAPLMDDGWTGNIDWNHNSWNNPSDSAEVFQYDTSNTFGIYNQTMLNEQNYAGYHTYQTFQ